MSDSQPKERAAPRPGQPRLHLFCEDAGTAAAASRAVEDRRLAGHEVSRRMGGVHAARAHYAGEPTPDLIVVESLLDARGILADMDALSEVCDPGTKVLVLGHVNDVLLYRELLRRHISDYLVAPIAPAQLAEAIAAALEGEAPEVAGRVVVFLGAKGGCGSSTVCHNTGWLLAEEMKAGTIIADFDLAFGTLGLDFNQDGGHGLAEALATSYKLDGESLGTLLAKCSDQLGLLTASYMLDADPEVKVEDAVRLVELLSRTVPFTLLDLPNEWRGFTKALVEQADDVVITAEPDLANLRNAKNLIDTARSMRATSKPPVLVMSRTGMPRRPEISIRDFANAVDLEPSVAIGFDAQLFGTAANNGLMIGECAPKSKHLDVFRELAQMLGGKRPAKARGRGMLAPLMERLGRRQAG